MGFFHSLCTRSFKNGEETTRKVIVDRVLDHLELPEDLRGKEYSKSESGQSVLANRIGFALADLYKANVINRPKRAVYQITEKGNYLLKNMVLQ